MDRLVYDSFPRSGSHFLDEAIRQSFSHYDVLWGQHIINNIRKENNVITVIRNTIDAISSWIYFRNLNESIIDNIDWYIRWMNATKNFENNICIITFDMLIKNVNLCMNKYKNKFNLSCYSNVSNYQIELLMYELHKDYFPRKYNDDFYVLKNKVSKSNEIKLAIKKI